MCAATSSIMDFYKAERNRVLWLREQNDTLTATAEAMEFEMMNDENTIDEADILVVQQRSGCKRPCQSDPPFLILNGK
ncbi:hypothetical protein COOONC_17131, partial [Cooperia oncophora]